MILTKFKKHFTGVYTATILMLLTVSISHAGMEAIAQINDAANEPSNYFVYEVGNEIVPTKDTYKVGEAPQFQSNATYFEIIHMRYEDTLVCNKRTYLTQPWEKTKFPGDSGTPWAYTIARVTEPDTCRMCSVVVGTTLRGNKKPISFCSKEFNFE